MKNGFDEEKAPLVFSLEYKLVDHQWLINEIHVVLVENENDFSKSAKCPDKYTNDSPGIRVYLIKCSDQWDRRH